MVFFDGVAAGFVVFPDCRSAPGNAANPTLGLGERVFTCEKSGRIQTPGAIGVKQCG